MIYEKSCGAVVYKLENGRRLYLVERTPSGKTVLPKGHVEAGETEAETARREIWEETHLVVSLDTSFREIAKYSPKPESEKTVVFFLAQPVSCDARPQPEEVDRLEWLPYEEAEAQITYPSVRKVLRKAEAVLAGRERLISP